MPGGPGLCPRWPAGGQLCPLQPPHLTPTLWLLLIPAGLVTLQMISCLLFSPTSQNPVSIPLCPGLRLLPLFYVLTPQWGVRGGAQKHLEEPHPSPPCADLSSSPCLVRDSNQRDRPFLELQHLEIKLTFVSKMNPFRLSSPISVSSSQDRSLGS